MFITRTKTRFLFVLAVLRVSTILCFTSPTFSFISGDIHGISGRHKFIEEVKKTSACSYSRQTVVLKNGKKGRTGLEENVSKNLLTETIAPFRGLRLFFYGAFASGAFVGGLITASTVVAALNGLRSDVDLNKEYMNLAIDFGAVALFGFLAKIDIDKGEELRASVEKKIETKKRQAKIVKAMRQREQQLLGLQLDVKVSEDGETRRATVGTMQEKAKQHIILVAGPRDVVRDALRGAQLNKGSVVMTNVLLIPYEIGSDEFDRNSKPTGNGFADRPAYERQPYVAEPVGLNWDDFITEEMNAAVEQSGAKARDEGITLVVANNGMVLKRGIGKIPWRKTLDELEETVSGEKKQTTVPFLELFE